MHVSWLQYITHKTFSHFWIRQSIIWHIFVKFNTQMWIHWNERCWIGNWLKCLCCCCLCYCARGKSVFVLPTMDPVSVYVVFIGFICLVTSIDDDDIEFKIKGFPFFIQKLMYLIFQAIIIWWWSFRNAWNIIHVCAVMLKLLNRSFYFSRWFSTVFKLLSFHLSCSLALYSIEVETLCPHTPPKKAWKRCKSFWIDVSIFFYVFIYSWWGYSFCKHKIRFECLSHFWALIKNERNIPNIRYCCTLSFVENPFSMPIFYLSIQWDEWCEKNWQNCQINIHLLRMLLVFIVYSITCWEMYMLKFDFNETILRCDEFSRSKNIGLKLDIAFEHLYWINFEAMLLYRLYPVDNNNWCVLILVELFHLLLTLFICFSWNNPLLILFTLFFLFLHGIASNWTWLSAGWEFKNFSYGTVYTHNKSGKMFHHSQAVWANENRA